MVVYGYKQNEEKKSTLRCAPSLLFSHGEKNSTPRKEALRKVDFFSSFCLLPAKIELTIN